MCRHTRPTRSPLAAARDEIADDGVDPELLLVSTAPVVVVALVLPYLPRIDVLGLVALPAPALALLVAITLLYVGAAAVTERWFHRGAA